MRAWLRRNPRPVALIIVGLALIAGFSLVVGPLFAPPGPPSAELAGSLPTRAVAGRPMEVDVGLDNSGTSVISPICVRVQVSGPLTPQQAVFQGIDTQPFRNGAFCGGSLNAQEDISIRLIFLAGASGTAQLSLTPAQAAAPVGRALTTSIAIADS